MQLLSELCVALREKCSTTVLQAVWAVLERLSVDTYRRLLFERFGGHYVILPTEAPASWPPERRALWTQIKADIVRGPQ